MTPPIPAPNAVIPATTAISGAIKGAAAAKPRPVAILPIANSPTASVMGKEPRLIALSTILGGLGIGTFQGGGTGFKDIFGKLSGFGKFANGGIVSAPTMGLMGEYPGAKSNPEVIAPLDKLKNMIGNTGGAQQVQVGGSFEIRGQDLVVALERANSTRNRLI